MDNDKKHIGIINLQFTNNYGAVIAAAVLEDVVGTIVGSDYIVDTIDFYPTKDFSNRIARYMDEAKQWGGWKLFLKAHFNKSNGTEASRLRGKRFKSFKADFLNLTPVIKDAYEINKDNNYSAFITGSDIVWAPKRTDNFRADGYYLKFANKGERRIAYAPSLDNVVNKKLLKISNYYRDSLKSLDYISVREKSNIDFIQSLTDKKVYHCADPAFLVDADYYDKMIDSAKIGNKQQKYIYVYILEINQEIVDYANKLATEKGLKICYYSANHSNYIENSEDCTADGPAEFLFRLKNAEYVLTNSFHCVVFSLIFKKKFLSFIRSSVSIKSTDLLECFNLSNRVVGDSSFADIDEEIDFSAVDKTLQKIKDESLDYLKNALSGIN